MKKLKQILIFTVTFFTPLFCFSQSKVPLSVQKELEVAETKMFTAILGYDMDYWKNNVYKDYITINADGIMQTAQEAMSDYEKKKFFSGMTYKLFDRKVRLYGNIAIITGRSQYLVDNKFFGEVYHTEIWIKDKGKWMFNGWHGTYTKETQAKLNHQ